MKKVLKRMLSVAMAAMVLSTAPVAAKAEAATVKLSQKKLTLNVGQKKTLKVKNTTAKITWKSSKSAVAAVSKKGVVTAKKAGTTVISAKVKGGKTYKCTVTVKAASSAKNNTSAGAGGTVYWTPSGAVYHVSRGCRSLARSRTVYSGSIAASRKSRVCRNCG